MPNPPLGTLVDPFTAATLNAAVWNGTNVAPTMVPALGMAQLPCPTSSNTNTLGANGPYDATGGVLLARITAVAPGNGGTRTVMKIVVDANNSVGIRLTSGVFTATSQTGGSTTTYNLPAYDPTAHAWWRLREASGTWFAEVAADGYDWTILATMPYGWSPVAVQVVLQTGASDTEPAGLFAGFEHVNSLTRADGLLQGWPQTQFQIAWNLGGIQPGIPLWNDHSSRMVGTWSATPSGRQYELDTVQSGGMTATLDNSDGTFDSTNASSPYFGSIKPFRRARMVATWPPTRNLLPQGLAQGSSLADTYGFAVTTSVLGTTTPGPACLTTAIKSTFSATTALASGYVLGVNNANSNIADENSIPLVTRNGSAVGQSVTVSGYLSAVAGGTSGLTMLIRLNWYDQTGTRIGHADGATATVPVQNAWVRATVTATVPAGAVWARPALLNAATTTVSNTVYSTGWQMEYAAAATPWTPPGITAPLWTGYLERTKRKWNGTTWENIDMVCVDALAGLSRTTLQPSLPAQLLSLGPTRMMPLDEPVGSTQFRDQTGMHAPGKVVNSPWGSGSLTAGNSISGTGFLGAAGPVITLANPAPSNTAQASTYINLGSPVGPPVTGGWTRLICFRTTTVPAAGVAMTLWNACSGAFGGASTALYIDSSQHLNGQATNANGQAVGTWVPTVSVCDGNWHMAAMILSPDGKTMNVNVDGAGFVSSSTFDCHPTGIVVDTIGVNAIPVNRFFGNNFSGDIAYVVEVPTNNVPSFPDIANGFSTGWTGESSAVRGQRILTLAGYPKTLTALGTQTPMGAANVGGQDAVTALNVVADSESGQTYVDAGGNVTLAGRLWRYLHSQPDVVFGENFAGGEVPYLSDSVAVDLDPDHIYNTVDVNNQVAPNAPSQPDSLASNAVSQQEYFTSSLTRTLNIADPNGAYYAATYLASQYAEPQPRISAVTIDPSANPALWSSVLALGFGSRARLMRRPNNSPNVTQLETFIEQLTWKGDPSGRLQLALQLSAASSYLGWWVVSSLHSTLQAQANAGSNTITLGALTGSALNPAAAVLPAGTVLTVGYGTAAAENATVKSVAVTTAGYTTVVVTLTANLASTHAAGLTVCQPVPGGYTMPASTLAAYPASLDAGATLSATGPRVTY